MAEPELCTTRTPLLHALSVRLLSLAVDRLLKGLYAAFLPEFQATLPAHHLLVMRTEDYVQRPYAAGR